MCSPCSSSSLLATCGCRMNSQCVGIQVEQAHTLTQHFFLLQCMIFVPNLLLFCCIVVIAIFTIIIVCCIVTQGRKGGSNVQVHLFHQYFL
jgi:hypothetical protein